MDNSAQIEQPEPELSPSELRPPEQKGIRRRWVQSTLFPHKPPLDREEKKVHKEGDERDCDRDENGENEECCGSQSKSKRKAKGKAMPLERAPKKIRQRRSGKTTPTTPKKTTPKKKISAKKTTPKKKLIYMDSEVAAPVEVPTLGLEAKLNSQENSQKFAGWQMFSYLSSCKSGNKNEGSRFSGGRKGKNITCGPIHVYERIQEDDVSPDWGTWNFREEGFEKRIQGPESMCTSIFEGSVQCLSFDKLPFVSYPSTLSNFQNETSSEQCSVQEESQSATIPIDSDVSDDEQLICCQPLKEADESKVNKVDSFYGHTGCKRKSDIEQQSRFLDERMKLYYFVCGNQPGNRLWTAKYQPTKAVEVCGNDESVKFLNEWLRLWRVRGFRIRKDHTAPHSDEMQDKDYSCSENDSDSEGKNEAVSMKNVLLITGPAGSGKSAAIYACAREQGYKVKEVNTSNWRSAAALKSEINEDSGLYQYERLPSNPSSSQNKHVAKFPSAFTNGSTPQELDEEMVELITSIDENLHNMIGASENSGHKEGRNSCCQREVKNLILLEDVDVTFVEDHGFIAAVKKIAEKAKQPIILTSNCPKPLLPDNLDRVQVSFSLPSSEELLCHVYMVCATERIKIQPHLLEQLIGCCQGDIRKILMQLQFWCQGRRSRKARKIEKTYGLLLFDLEASHQILPKLIPWDSPSRLSELVAKEITESLSRKENTLTEVVRERYPDNKELKHSLVIHNNEAESIEAKKVAMLSRNGSVHDHDDFAAQFDMPSDFCDNSDTPFSCKRNVRRKYDVVLSSGSEDEFFINKNFKVSDKHTNNEALFEVKLPCFEEANIDGKNYELSETADLLLTDTNRSANISCVPESSFVPETEINDGIELQSGTVSSGHVDMKVDGVSVSDWLPVETISYVISEPGMDENSDTLASTPHEVGQLCHQEKVEDSQNDLVEVVASEYQVMDEFSRMGSNSRFKVMKPISLVATDLVQKSWNKLRSCHTDLRRYAESELQHASQLVQLTWSMTDLISDTDLLLSNCQLLTTDSLETSVILPESDAYRLYDERLLLASTIAQHGFCFYIKDIFAVGSIMGYESTVNLASEMMGSTTDMMAWGKVVGEHPRSRSSCNGRNSESSLPKSDISLKSKAKSCLFDIIQSTVPSKSYMTLKGVAFNEYLSSLRNISRSEASRLSENIDNTRRKRVARHYLSTGKLMLSPEDISMLGQFNLYEKHHSQQTDAVSTQL
ncbi:uncharacterized protein LOC107421034 isoform X1 [Ziziphus jujuba]|uniref:Uncharacterized protein LOC107421034 isoform X1 n=1 Tax=Ziziphus jujuba TaxID=326968 RepID=A0ABM3IND2_ZIZJJ|nr:uncharacterized protein LOC107421034 isoform X1 [Ziziphus jujuba]